MCKFLKCWFLKMKIMKKRILSLCAVLISVIVFSINITLVQNDQSSNLTLKSLTSIQQAQAEDLKGVWIVTFKTPDEWTCTHSGGCCCPGWDC